MVAIRITQEHYGALYSPYRKVVVLNDLRVWISMRRSDAERGGTTLLGVYVRRGKSNLNDFEFVPVELWLRARPGYDAEAYGEVVILSDPGVVYIQDPNEFLLGQTVVLAVLPGSPRIE